MIALACATLSCDGFGDEGFGPSFDLLPQLGFRYVEFNCWHAGDLTPARIREVKKRCDDTGLIPMAVYSNAFGGADRADICKDIAHKLRMLEAAQELSCQRIVATGAKRGGAGGLDAVIRTLSEVAPVAEERGIQVCLENHQFSNLESMLDYSTIMNSISSSSVGVCIDTGHFISAGVDVLALIDRFWPRIHHVHLKEKKEHTDSVVYYEEENYKILDKLQRMGYDGFLTIEIPPESSEREDICRGLRKAKETYSRYEST